MSPCTANYFLCCLIEDTTASSLNSEDQIPEQTKSMPPYSQVTVQRFIQTCSNILHIHIQPTRIYLRDAKLSYA